jgi:hypothetical protein
MGRSRFVAKPLGPVRHGGICERHRGLHTGDEETLLRLGDPDGAGPQRERMGIGKGNPKAEDDILGRADAVADLSLGKGLCAGMVIENGDEAGSGVLASLLGNASQIGDVEEEAVGGRFHQEALTLELGDGPAGGFRRDAKHRAHVLAAEQLTFAALAVAHHA